MANYLAPSGSSGGSLTEDEALSDTTSGAASRRSFFVSFLVAADTIANEFSLLMMKLGQLSSLSSPLLKEVAFGIAYENSDCLKSSQF